MPQIDFQYLDSLTIENKMAFIQNSTNPAILPQISTNIFPFPAGPDCCCPEDAACLHRSANGEYYVFAKGIQKRS